jgi:hypothetical protein
VLNTKPSHSIGDYSGTYEDAAYGKLKIEEQNGKLKFTFNNTSLPLEHYHYDRFVSADDPIDGKWSLFFSTDAQGAIQHVKISMDEKEVDFLRKADSKLSDVAFLKTLTGSYELNGNILTLVVTNNDLVITSAPPQHLEPYTGNKFKIREFSDQTVEFHIDGNTKPTGFTLTYDGKSVFFTKKK